MSGFVGEVENEIEVKVEVEVEVELTQDFRLPTQDSRLKTILTLDYFWLWTKLFSFALSILATSLKYLFLP